MGYSKLLYRILKLIKYANLCTFFKNHKNCFFFPISNPILILFALYDSTKWGIQNLYTELWNSLNMLIYAHFSKITKIASSPFLTWFELCLLYMKVLGGGWIIYTVLKLIKYANLHSSESFNWNLLTYILNFHTFIHIYMLLSLSKTKFSQICNRQFIICTRI